MGFFTSFFRLIRQPVAKKGLFLLLFLLLGLGLWHSQALAVLHTSSPQALRESALAYAQHHPVGVYAAFSITYIGVTVFSLPIATVVTLIGGALFGSLWGTVIVVFSATIGASILFLIAKSTIGGMLQRKAARFYPKVKEEMEHNAWFYLLSLRLVPLFPFFVVNIVPALFPVSLFQFVVTTFFGIIPGTAVYVHLGATVSDISNVAGLISPQVLIAFGLLGVLSLAPIIVKKLRKAP